MACFRRNFRPHFRRERAPNLAELVYHSMGVHDRKQIEQRVAHAIRCGSNPNEVDFRGRVALHHACALEDWPEMVMMLVTAERFPPVPPTDVSLREDFGTRRTPLHVAVQHSNIGSVKKLLEFGADPTIRDTDGILPHDLASENENTEILALLDAHTKPLGPMERLNSARAARHDLESSPAASWWVLKLPETKQPVWCSEENDFDDQDSSPDHSLFENNIRRKIFT